MRTHLSFRCPESVHDALKAIAKKRKRDVTAQVLVYIRAGLKRDKVEVEVPE